MSEHEMTIGFIGNPNCGKTTLFNAYTGANLKVANWPGVTVEKVEGVMKDHDLTIHLVDLPGTYSLTSYTMEETVSRQFILSDEVDVIINVADASALERSLYLTLQLLELGKPVVLALNMMDIVEKRGMEIDLHRLPEMLGIPVIPVSARQRRGLDILLHAAAHHKDCTDPDCLIHHHTLGALALAIYENGDYLEAIAVMLFYQVGEWFQSYAVGKSRRNISDLMDIRPDYANIERDGKLEQVDPDEVGIGTIIVVQPGEKVPIDGMVVQGESTLNTAALTGESLLREVKTGDEIISGCINMTGLLHIQTTKEFGESTVSKILDLVENASSRKSKSEDFISRFAKIYTPAVCYAALALAILPPLVRMFAMGLDAGWETWIYRALTFLVASCPCALVISIPLSFFAGIGGASKAGVLVKGSNYLETLSQTKLVVFDKTGTLTQGVFEVNAIHHNEMDEHKLVEYAALAESASSHPISKSLQKAYGMEIDRSRVTNIQELSGNGVIATVDGH